MATLTIGKVARSAGIGIETVRFYERSGLLESPPRTRAGYRLYPPETIDRLAFIKRAQRLGFSLSEITELLALHESTVPCDDVKARALTKVAAIEEKVAVLQSMRSELLALVERCDAVCDTSCTVLFTDAPCQEEERWESCPGGC